MEHILFLLVDHGGKGKELPTYHLFVTIIVEEVVKQRLECA